jgi:hypothetical protein
VWRLRDGNARPRAGSRPKPGGAVTSAKATDAPRSTAGATLHGARRQATRKRRGDDARRMRIAACFCYRDDVVLEGRRKGGIFGKKGVPLRFRVLARPVQDPLLGQFIVRSRDYTRLRIVPP